VVSRPGATPARPSHRGRVGTGGPRYRPQVRPRTRRWGNTWEHPGVRTTSALCTEWWIDCLHLERLFVATPDGMCRNRTASLARHRHGHEGTRRPAEIPQIRGLHGSVFYNPIQSMNGQSISISMKHGQYPSISNPAPSQRISSLVVVHIYLLLRHYKPIVRVKCSYYVFIVIKSAIYSF